MTRPQAKQLRNNNKKIFYLHFYLQLNLQQYQFLKLELEQQQTVKAEQNKQGLPRRLL